MAGGHRGQGPTGRAHRMSGTPWLLPIMLAALATVPWLLPLLENEPLDLGTLVPCTSGRPQLVIAGLDVSSSVIDPDGADPQGRSFEELVRAAEMLRDTPCSNDDRVGAVIFAERSVEVPPIPTSSHSVIEATVQRPPVDEIGDGTLIVPALDRVQRMIDRFPDHEPTILVLSDMRSDETELAAVLSGLPDSAHLIALGDHDPVFDDEFASIVRLDSLERGEVGSAIIDLINRSREVQ